MGIVTSGQRLRLAGQVLLRDTTSYRGSIGQRIFIDVSGAAKQNQTIPPTLVDGEIYHDVEASEILKEIADACSRALRAPNLWSPWFGLFLPISTWPCAANAMGAYRI